LLKTTDIWEISTINDYLISQKTNLSDIRLITVNF